MATAASLKLVQYVIVRKDLLSDMQWPLGAVIAQACHACTAVIHQTYDDQHTKTYLEDLDNMHKVILTGKDQTAIEGLAKVLEDNNIIYKLWTEQPENYPTCLALKPYPKDEVHRFVKKFKLFS